MTVPSGGRPNRYLLRDGAYEWEARSTWPPLLWTGRGNHENLPRPSLCMVVSPVAFG
jgi:hypothetical protein